MTPQERTSYYNKQYNARAAIPDHPYIFTRWVKSSAEVRRRHAGLFDLAYGEASGERLDFFPAARAGAPLLIFIHGGWWRSLDKSDFSFIAPAFLNAGMNVALTNYTLAPRASIAEIVCQQLRAVAWLYRHTEQYEIDPHRIVIAGHSAGAHLAAMMMAAHWQVYDSDFPADLIKAGILLSGLYDLSPLVHTPFVNADLKLRPEDADKVSPAWISLPRKLPFITAVGGQESDEFQRQTRLIEGVWRHSHRGTISLLKANHLTICDDFADPSRPLCRHALELCKSL